MWYSFRFFLHGFWNEFFVEKEDVLVRREVITVPNFITGIGMLGVIFYGYALITGYFDSLIPFVVIGVGLSDMLDGIAARRLNQHSYLGKIIDPVRDRLLSVLLLANFVLVSQRMPVYFLAAAIVIVESFVLIKHTREFFKTQNGSRTHTFGKMRQFIHLTCGSVFIAEVYWPNQWSSFLPYVPFEILLTIMLIASSYIAANITIVIKKRT